MQIEHWNTTCRTSPFCKPLLSEKASSIKIVVIINNESESTPPPAPTTTGPATAGTAAAAVYSHVPSNFPIPAPVVCKGNLVANWEFFRQQWEYYEVATSLDKQTSQIRLASLRSVMRKDCLQTFLNLNISVEDRNNVEACMTALENLNLNLNFIFI